MKQLSILTLLISSLLVFGSSCSKADNKEKTSENVDALSTTCFKGRLEIKAMCGNYTVKVLEGNIDPSLIQQSWKDRTTGKTYENVFRLANSCNLPSSVKEGDEFYFQIQNKNEECAECQAYYPTPEKSLHIKVLDKACSNSSN